MTDQKIIEILKIKPGERVLDVGGSGDQHDEIPIDTLVDICRPENFPYRKSKLTAKKFVQRDIVNQALPFKDKEFDVCLCTHTLEDLSNPVPIIKEMERVAKRGLIITPSRGKDMEFSHYNLTEWRTGGMRQPGNGHHKWLFEDINGVMTIIVKSYPLLYTSEFFVTKWKGEKEFIFTWKGHIRHRIVEPLSYHELINDYRDFVRRNKADIQTGRVVWYWDNPYYFIKEQIKRVLHRGAGFRY